MDDKILIVAELSCNHMQDYACAVKTIRKMSESGADAVKVQVFTASSMTIESKEKYFRIRGGTLWDGKTLYQLYQKAFTPWEWLPKLKKIADDLGLGFIASPFDKAAIEFLKPLGVTAFKIASFEITDKALIENAAASGKPIFISTGVATYEEIKQAVALCRQKKNYDLTLLKCTSAYPARYSEMNLKLIPKMSRDFKCPVGVSDHTVGFSVPIAAVALGARVIEKHFILKKGMKSLDAAFSLDPAEFKMMVKGAREAHAALGDADYALSRTAKKNRQFCRSLFLVKDINAGEPFTPENLRSIRPGYGISPWYLSGILRMKARVKIKKGTPLKWNLTAGKKK